MSRKRNPKRDEAFEIWKKHKGEITNKEIAEQVDAPAKTISAWKSRDKWSAALKPDECSTTKKKRSTTTKKKEKEVFVESDDLNDKQRLFCIYYIKYWNATKAYQKAYKCDYMTAQSIAYRLMGNDGIKKEIDRLRKERMGPKLLSADNVLQKYIDIAFADIGDFVKRGDEGYSVSVRPLEEMDSSIISELSNTENGIKIKLLDKMKALDFLAKYFEMNPDRAFTQRIAKERLAIDKARLTNEQDGQETQDDWKDALLAVAERRKEMRENE